MQDLHSFLIQVSQELNLPLQSVNAVIELMNSGNTVPFIARYRKEVTGNLDEVQIRDIQERYHYLKELDERRQSILNSIDSQGKLTPELKQQILNCTVKTTLEDLYLPYKPKRRTRAMIAREKGLEPLAELILTQSLHGNPDEVALNYINSEKGVETVVAALSGARDIIAEKIAEDAEIRALVRAEFAAEGIIISKVRSDKVGQSSKFEQYYDFKEKIKTIPSHRYLAIRRGEKEEFLDFSIEIEEEPVLQQIARSVHVKNESPYALQLIKAIEDAYRRLIKPSVETDARLELKADSDRAAVDVFANNLRHLLLAAPLGGKNVIGIDPGLRTGCKCVAVSETGKFLDTVTIYPSQGTNALTQSKSDLLKFINKFKPYAIAVGNGTGGRETELFVRELLKEHEIKDVLVIAVNEAGASVYSASDVAREEFPDLDLTIRGSISIARRLQDPLSELVKIDPKSIGVGQYQHDVQQNLLQQKLNDVVESCVNHVGVDLNTSSSSLLSYVSGIGLSLAQKIVKYRNEQGAFLNRNQLKKVPGFGAKTFEQAAGFLRIRNGDNPLDASAVHPERYELVEHMATDLGVSLTQIISQPDLIKKIDQKKYLTNNVGELTLKDILQELNKPGRDPRASFEPPRFQEGINSISDLKPGLKLEGIVTNVTAFGAFVDIGVHQDGLIHLSELADRYIKHPDEVVSTGDRINVEVVQVDVERKRISLTARIGKKDRFVPETKGQPSKALKPVKKEFSNNPFSSL